MLLCDGPTIRVSRYDALGRGLWSVQWSDPDGAETRAIGLAAALDGPQLFVVGDARFKDGPRVYLPRYSWVRRLHEDGSLVWQRNYRSGMDYMGGVCVDAAGDVYLSRANIPFNAGVGYLEKLDGSTSETLWQRSWGAAIDDTYPNTYNAPIVCTLAGPVVANKLEWAEPATGVVRLRAYSPEGELRWAQDHELAAPGLGPLGGITSGPKGDLLVSASVDMDDAGYTPSVGRYDGEGDPILTWEAEGAGLAQDLALDEDDSMYLLALDLPYDDIKRSVVVQVKADGEPGWVHEVELDGSEREGGIVADRLGRLLIVDGSELRWVGR